jgi:peptidoglycan/LPS O-acetylase OafA/YrhL
MTRQSFSTASATAAACAAPTKASVHLDAVRGIAALAVFLGHGRALFLNSGLGSALAHIAAASTDKTLATSTPHLTVGHEAVVVFFVLSGYFVGGSVLRSVRQSRFQWGTYLLQRMTRLWVVLIPSLLLGLAVDLAGMHLLGGPHSIYAGLVGTEVLPGLQQRVGIATLTGNIFFLQNSVVSYLGTNVALWSLACEFWYYIQFPLLVGIFGRDSRPWQRCLYAVLLAASAELIGWRIMQYLPLWLAGCAVAAWPGKVSPTLLRSLTLFALAATIATLLLCLRLHVGLYPASLSICAAFTPLLWLTVQQTCPSQDGLYRRTAQALSKMSYTLYAVHFPLLVFLCALTAPQWRPQTLSLHSAAVTALALAAVFCAAAALYWLFEARTKTVQQWLTESMSGRVRLAEANPVLGAATL